MKLTRLDPALAERLQTATIATAKGAVAAELAARDATIAGLTQRIAALEAMHAKLKGALT